LTVPPPYLYSRPPHQLFKLFLALKGGAGSLLFIIVIEGYNDCGKYFIDKIK
jgi:hypothetical protein